MKQKKFSYPIFIPLALILLSTISEAHEPYKFLGNTQISSLRNYCVNIGTTFPADRCSVINPKNACFNLLQDALTLKLDKTTQTDLEYELAEYSLYNGYLDESVNYFQAVLDAPRYNNSHPRRDMLLNLAIAQLRMGEVTNCQNDHNADRCIFPLNKNALHNDKRGSISAIQTLKTMLEAEPDHPLLRWLLNVAYMTIGEYPAGVPGQYLIPPENFQSRETFPRFDNIAVSLGFNHQGLAGGVIIDDFNNDGNMDIVMSSFGYCDPVRIFINNGIDGFNEKTDGSGLDKQLSASHMIQADYNNDGLLDIYITRGLWENPFQPREYEYAVDVYNTLLRNTGNGHFVDVTDETGLRSAGPNYNISSIWSDFNNDGYVDLFVCNNMRTPKLFVNQHGQSFRQLPFSTGLANSNMCMGVAAGDINNDGFMDIFLSSVDGDSQLFINRGNGKNTSEKLLDYFGNSSMDPLLLLDNNFSISYGKDLSFDFPDNIAFESISGFRKLIPQGRAFASILTDFDNDGLLDIFVGGYQGSLEYKDTGRIMAGEKIEEGNSVLLKNLGNGNFINSNAKPENAIMVMGANVGDFNNDGYEDLLLGTGSPALESIMPNRGFLNHGGKGFADITFAGGFGNLQKGHGISFGDLDNDGDQDIIAMFGGFFPSDTFFPSIYSNPGFSSHWITLRLEGVKSNRSAIGTRIIIEIEENGTSRNIHRIVSSGGSFGSNSLQVEAGLGNATKISKLVVLWAGSGTTSIYENVPLDKILKIREGDKNFSIIEQSPVHFKANTQPAHHEHHSNPF